MEGNIIESASSFSQFLTEKQTILKSIPNALVSFAFDANEEYSNFFRNSLNLFERSFYFEKPDDNFLFIGLGEVLTVSENGERRFSAAENFIKENKQKFISNWDELNLTNIPLFVGGMKFMIEHSDEDWEDFNDSTWFVPEISFLKIEQKTFIIFNSVISKFSAEKISEKLKLRLQNIMAAVKTPEKSIRILNEISIPKEKKKWKQKLSEALDLIEDNRVQKIVFSRKIELILSEEFDIQNYIKKLSSNYPACYNFVFHQGRSFFFGATPEKLAKFSGNKIEIDALAGSAPRGKNEKEDSEFETELLSNEKNLQEHKFVVDHLKQTLEGITTEINLLVIPKVKKLPNIQHLWTPIEAVLNDDVESVFTALKNIYPTPAICGMPKNESFQAIKKLENHKRGLYSGIIGWFNLNNEGEFVIAIRSALTYNKKLIAYAGSGIVINSDPDLEFLETELKLKPIMSLLKNENKNKS
jgi:menaquinone-specific isochorismate synthase